MSEDRLSASDLAALPDDIAGEIASKRQARQFTKREAVTPAPSGPVDETPTKVIVMAHNKPWATVLTPVEDEIREPYEEEVETPYEEETKVPDGFEVIKNADGTKEKVPAFKIEKVKKTRVEKVTKYRIRKELRYRRELRALDKRERVLLPRHEAEKLDRAELVSILETSD